jgi:hypothetical protein
MQMEYKRKVYLALLCEPLEEWHDVSLMEHPSIHDIHVLKFWPLPNTHIYLNIMF